MNTSYQHAVLLFADAVGIRAAQYPPKVAVTWQESALESAANRIANPCSC